MEKVTGGKWDAESAQPHRSVWASQSYLPVRKTVGKQTQPNFKLENMK